MAEFSKIAIHAAQKPRAQKAAEELTSIYGSVPIEDADCLVVLGGDGGMLHALHDTMDHNIPIYGMNMGTLGFLMNTYERENLYERINQANRIEIHPLRMKATDKHGETHDVLAFNEVSLLRETHRTAKIAISINGKKRLEELVCDGVMVSTAMGSTAYNSSAGGPILPLYANVLPITPISSFRPRRWSGALVKNDSSIALKILRPNERPVSATADSTEIRDVIEVEIHESTSVCRTLLFDENSHLQERIYAEQFSE